MNNRFWTKIIVFITAFMMLVNGILPTNVVIAGDWGTLTCTKEGYYLLASVSEKVNGVLATDHESTPNLGFGNAGIDDIYYIEGGIEKEVECDGNGRVYLYEGVTYHYRNKAVQTIQNGDPINGYTYTNIIIEYELMDVESNPELDANLKEGKGHNTDGPIVVEKEQDNASLIESVITEIILFIGRCLYAIVCLVIGEPFSIEKVIFNEYGNTKLGFFSGSETNNFIEKSGIKNILNDFFDFFTGIAIVVYLIILVYMAIRIMLSSTAEKGSKYKELLLYWVEGVAILFLFPYVMKYSIEINNSFVSFIAANKTEYFEEHTFEYNENGKLIDMQELNAKTSDDLMKKTDYMSVMYKQAAETGWLVLAICWFVMFVQMFGFLVVYFKRILVMIFLIAIFPLVMISYAIDKIGDAKSQAFGAWVNEFMLNVFIQSFHAIAYVLIMSIIFELMDSPSDNWLLILIAITFISKGDDILRGIFSLNSKANTVKGLHSTILQAAAFGTVAKSLKKTKDRLVGEKSALHKTYNKFNNLTQLGWDKYENKVKKDADNIELSGIDLPVRLADLNSVTDEEIKRMFANDLGIILGKNANATPKQIRDALARIAEMKNSDNENTKRMFNELYGTLTGNDKTIFDKLLAQNDAAKAIMAGGRNIDINDNIHIILENMVRDSQNNIVPASKVILNKIGKSEKELLIADRLRGKNSIKLAKVKEETKEKSKTKKVKKEIIRGRSASKARKASSDSKNSLECIRNSRVSDKAKEKLQPNTATATEDKNKNKPWENVVSASNDKNSKKKKTTSSSGLDNLIKYSVGNDSDETNNSTTTTSYGNVVPEAKGIKGSADKSPRGVREMQETKKQILEQTKKDSKESDPLNSTAFTAGTKKETKPDKKEKTSSSQNTTHTSSKQNMGGDIANVSGTAEDLESRLADSSNGGIVDERISATKDITKDFNTLFAAINKLNDSNKGMYTAEELLDTIAVLKETAAKYDNASESERARRDTIMDLLGCSVQDFESDLRVKILNYPESVGNNREIIEECKAYVKTTEMPDFIRQSLGYNLEDLKENKNLEYVKSRDTRYDGIVSEEERDRSKLEEELRKRKIALEKDIEQREKKDRKDYNSGVFISSAFELGTSAVETGLDVLGATTSAGLGFVTSGTLTKGDSETITEAVSNTLLGFAASNELYDNTVIKAYEHVTDKTEGTRGWVAKKIGQLLGDKKDEEEKK